MTDLNEKNWKNVEFFRLQIFSFYFFFLRTTRELFLNFEGTVLNQVRFLIIDTLTYRSLKLIHRDLKKVLTLGKNRQLVS